MRIYLISFIFLLVCTKFGSGDYDCPVKSCSKLYGPKIRFPFRLKGRHSEHCGYPGFDLYCSQSKETVLELPSSAKTSIKLPHSIKLIVKEIDYVAQSIALSKVDRCLPDLFPKLNLTASPFRLEDPGDYTFFNCPSETNPNPFYMKPAPCLSNSSYHVYAVHSHQPFYGGQFTLNTPYVAPLFSCRKMFNISSVSLMFSDAILLTWSKPVCKPCEADHRYCRLKNQGSTQYTECFLPGALKKLIEGVLISSFMPALIIFLGLIICCSFKKKRIEDQKRIKQFLEDYKALQPTRYTYADIKKITNHFKEKLGQGGYGTVYKGKLSNDILVAVKVLNDFKGNGEEFINEVATIGRIHHVNVVRLVGYCADGCRRGLVYEFLPNESLEKFISSRNKSRSLGWEKLQQIAIGIAKGLDYLHQGCNQRILHFDIKPQNILLDQNFNPKVADFGLAKLCSKEESIVSMTAARGTIGYIAPEVFSRNYGNVSYKADIYSFGMLLLDLVGGRKNFHVAAKDNSEVYFPEWMYNQLEKGEEITIQIEKEEDNKIFKKLTIVGLWCIQWYPADRPSMKVVIQMIEGDDIPTMPPNPFASTKSSAANASASRSKFYNELETISEGD